MFVIAAKVKSKVLPVQMRAKRSQGQVVPSGPAAASVVIVASSTVTSKRMTSKVANTNQSAYDIQLEYLDLGNDDVYNNNSTINNAGDHDDDDDFEKISVATNKPKIINRYGKKVNASGDNPALPLSETEKHDSILQTPHRDEKLSRQQHRTGLGTNLAFIKYTPVSENKMPTKFIKDLELEPSAKSSTIHHPETKKPTKTVITGYGSNLHLLAMPETMNSEQSLKDYIDEAESSPTTKKRKSATPAKRVRAKPSAVSSTKKKKFTAAATKPIINNSNFKTRSLATSSDKDSSDSEVERGRKDRYLPVHLSPLAKLPTALDVQQRPLLRNKPNNLSNNNNSITKSSEQVLEHEEEQVQEEIHEDYQDQSTYYNVNVESHDHHDGNDDHTKGSDATAAVEPAYAVYSLAHPDDLLEQSTVSSPPSGALSPISGRSYPVTSHKSAATRTTTKPSLDAVSASVASGDGIAGNPVRRNISKRRAYSDDFTSADDYSVPPVYYETSSAATLSPANNGNEWRSGGVGGRDYLHKTSRRSLENSSSSDDDNILSTYVSYVLHLSFISFVLCFLM